MIRKAVGVFFGLVVALCCVPMVQAQATTSVLSGEVLTAEGVLAVGAMVKAQAEATGVLRTAITDERGRYRFGLLEPGRWTVTVRLPGGQVYPSKTVDLGLQEDRHLDFGVPERLTETVKVVADKPIVDPTRVGSEHRIEGGRAARLPILGRQITDLALLDSAVLTAAPGNFYGERGAVFTVNGQSGRSNSFLVDGLDNNDQLSGTSMNSFFSQQVIQEFVVMTHQYAPEFGRASGGVLNVITRRGDNDFETEAFVQGTTGGWNSAGSFVEGLPGEGSENAVSRFQAGMWMGGPMRKDRSFYFLAFEHNQADEVVPFTGIDRAGNLGGWMVAPAESDNFFARADFVLGASNTLMMRFSADDRRTDGVNVGGLRTPESGFRIEERDYQFALTLNSVASPMLFNEVRLLAGRSHYDQFGNSGLASVNRPSGIFGGNELNRQERREDWVQLVENITWIQGNHTLKFGVDVTRSTTELDARFNPQGNFLYEGDEPFEPGDCGGLSPNDVVDRETWEWIEGPIPCPGNPLEDDDQDGQLNEDGFITSYPLVYTLVDGQPSETFDDTRWSLFAQDSWQAGPRVRLDYGLRYDLSTFELPEDAGVPSTIPNGGARKDTDNVAPRFGFTFTPGKQRKLVFRGGAGIFYDKLVLAFPAVAAVTNETSIKFFFPRMFSRLGLSEQNIAEELDGLNVLSLPELELRFSTGTELDTPYAAQYNLGVERQVGSRHALSAGVTRALGYHLPLFRDLNPPARMVSPGVCEDPVFRNCFGVPAHRDQNTGSIVAVVTEGRSWYSSVDLNYRWQGDDSWFSAAYTWSKAEDLGFDPLKNGVSLPSNSDDLLADRGRSDGDRRHRLVLSGESALPMGLRASVVMQLATGIPFNVVTGTDDNLDGFLFERPEGVGRNTGEDTSLSAVNAWRETEDLEPFNGRLEEPNFAQLDLRIWKPLASQSGNVDGELFVQIFNLLNRSNGALIEGRANSSKFGEVVGLAGPPLTVEAGVKLGF